MTNEKFITDKEFKREIKKLGYEIEIYKYDCCIVDSRGARLATVNTTVPMEMSTYHTMFEILPTEERKKLFNLLIQYTTTPIANRIENDNSELKPLGKNKLLISKEIKKIEKRFNTRSKHRG